MVSQQYRSNLCRCSRLSSFRRHWRYRLLWRHRWSRRFCWHDHWIIQPPCSYRCCCRRNSTNCFGDFNIIKINFPIIIRALSYNNQYQLTNSNQTAHFCLIKHNASSNFYKPSIHFFYRKVCISCNIQNPAVFWYNLSPFCAVLKVPLSNHIACRLHCEPICPS